MRREMRRGEGREGEERAGKSRAGLGKAAQHNTKRPAYRERRGIVRGGQHPEREAWWQGKRGQHPEWESWW